MMAGKAIASAAVKKGLTYGAKKALAAARRKKRVGRISTAQAMANQRMMAERLRRWRRIAQATS